jgi:hypothetical protein
MRVLFFLYGLATLDAVLIGHHAAIGKNPLVNKGSYWVRSVQRGFVAGQLSLLLISLVTLLCFSVAGDTEALFADCVESGAVVLWGVVPYAVLLLSGLGFYPTRWKVLTNVLVLGPFTLLRTPVLTGAIVAGVWANPRWEVGLILGTAWGTTMLVKHGLRRYPPGW